LMGESGLPITPEQVQAGVNAYRAYQSGNMPALVSSVAQLSGSKDANIAAKAFVVMNALQSGNPFAMNAAILNLYKAAGGPTAGGTGGGAPMPGEMQGIWEGWDPSGGEGVTTSDVVDVLGNTLPSDAVDVIDLLDRDIASTTQPGQRVVIPGGREAAETETPVMVRPTPAPRPGQSVPVIGTRESPSLGDQFLNDLLDQTVKPEQVTVTGTKLPKDDIADQSVSVTGTKIAAPAPSPAPAPSAPAPAPAPRAPAPATQVTATRAPTPQQDMSYITELPLYQSVFYKEMKEKERREQLARELEQQENADPYERLMDLAERNPEMAVDELMKIVEGT